ncbi:hypothetical protein I546_6285 [Mycobacterium kansasii 732]|nr:hypothetical protein I546_6285 [Mycobacterium kansasii 732]
MAHGRTGAGKANLRSLGEKSGLSSRVGDIVLLLIGLM